ncbi:MAG: citrate/2-methylcitrate synthase [Anaerolineales bacterium]
MVPPLVPLTAAIDVTPDLGHFTDGERGILEYRGYPIAQLAKESTFLEGAYLIIFGELPTQQQLDEWVFDITHNTFLKEQAIARPRQVYLGERELDFVPIAKR